MLEKRCRPFEVASIGMGQILRETKVDLCAALARKSNILAQTDRTRRRHCSNDGASARRCDEQRGRRDFQNLLRSARCGTRYFPLSSQLLIQSADRTPCREKLELAAVYDDNFGFWDVDGKEE
jgi:hypothetical protein